jgi:hypothetical protein
MRLQLTDRLTQLKTEYEAGQRMLTELEQKQRTLRDTLLRISGAIQVLEEELGSASQAALADAPQPNGAQPRLELTNAASRS